MKTKTTHSPEETKRLGAELALRILGGKPGKKAMVVGLFGNLGSGKTTFVQGFMKAAGWKKRVTSPTFIIMRRYPLRLPAQAGRKNFRNVYHLDAYRLQVSDVMHLGFEKLKDDPRNIILIEWPENILGRRICKIKVKLLHGAKENERIVKTQ